MEAPKPIGIENLSVPDQIFKKFFEELKKTNISIEIVDQLQTAITAKDNPSEVTIKAALFFQPPII